MEKLVMQSLYWDGEWASFQKIIILFFKQIINDYDKRKYIESY